MWKAIKGMACAGILLALAAIPAHAQTNTKSRKA